MSLAATETDRNLDAVLYVLIENMTVPVSGEKLARDLGIFHSRVVRLVDKLRADGVEILGEPFSGFRLTRLPDVLMPELIQERLHTREIGRTLPPPLSDRFDKCLCGRFVGLGPGHVTRTVVVAEKQTAGRGRLGRSWISMSGVGLYLTIVLRPDIPCHLAPLLTLGTALAAHDAIERTSGLEVDIKWPNDLLVGGKKVCGVLSELHAELDRVRSLIIGVGVNINHNEIPEEIREIGTSLRIESGRNHSRIEILVDFLSAI